MPCTHKKPAFGSEQVTWFLLFSSLHSQGERRVTCKIERMVSESLSARKDIDWEEEASLGREAGVRKGFSEEGSFELRPECWVGAMISWPCSLRRPSPFKISFSSVLRRAECSILSISKIISADQPLPCKLGEVRLWNTEVCQVIRLVGDTLESESEPWVHWAVKGMFW